MSKFISLLLVMSLGGCAAAPTAQQVSACAASEASYACQVERYHNVSAP